MNLTIGKTTFGTWKRIKTQYVATACGLALAVAVLAAFAGWPEGGSGAARVTAPALSLPQRVAPQAEKVFYIVGSAELAQAVIADEQELFLRNQTIPGASTPDRRIEVIDTSTPAGEAAFAGLLQSLEYPGSGVEVIDLRSN